MDAMDITAIIKAVLAPHKEGTGSSMIALKPGDQLTGRVLKIASDGRVLLDLGGKRAFAQIDFPVKTGQNLQLQVVDSGALLHLRAISTQSGPQTVRRLPHTDFSRAISLKDQGRFIDIVSRMVGESHGMKSGKAMPTNIQDALANIKTVFDTIPMGRTTQQISNWVKNAVDHRGLLFEKQLADAASEISKNTRVSSDKNQQVQPARIIITRNTKSQLIQLKHYFLQMGGQDPAADKFDSNEVRFLRQCVDQLLGHIEQQQDRAVANWRDGEPHQALVHSMEFQDQKRPVQLKVYYPKNKGRDSEHEQHRVALLLDMDALGAVRVDLAMMARQLVMGFYVESPRVQKLMEQHIQKVKSSLAGRFDTIQVNVAISQEKIARFNKADTGGEDTARINLKV
jgi:hypothetical protein